MASKAKNTAASHPYLDEANREIRLVRLLCDRDDETIACELQAFSLNDQPEYEALSYCWTQADPTCTILVSDTVFHVRPNLFNYLKLRNEERDTGWIFIDAICIDQQNLAERNAQVRLMGDIYRGAARVVVWLGNDDRLQVCDPEVVAAVQQHCEGTQILDFEKIGQGDPVQRRALWAGFQAAFLPPEYWSRAWIVQEIALSRQTVLRYRHLTLGQQSFKRALLLNQEGETTLARISRGGILAAVKLRGLENDPIAINMNGLESLAFETAVNVSFLEELSHGDMYELVTLFARQKSSMWHDRMFALLGLTNSVLLADYRMCRVELYARVLSEGCLELSWPEDDTARSVWLELDLFLPGLLVALDVVLHEPVIALLTAQIMTRCGVDHFLHTLKRVPRKLGLAQGQDDHVLRRFEKTQRRMAVYKALPMIHLPGAKSESTRTYRGWTKWADNLVDETRESMRERRRVSAVLSK